MDESMGELVVLNVLPTMLKCLFAYCCVQQSFALSFSCSGELYKYTGLLMVSKLQLDLTVGYLGGNDR